jgi:hypothetical protein
MARNGQAAPGENNESFAPKGPEQVIAQATTVDLQSPEEDYKDQMTRNEQRIQQEVQTQVRQALQDQAQNQTSDKQKESPSSFNKRKLYCMMTCILVLAGIGAGVYFATKRDNSSSFSAKSDVSVTNDTPTVLIPATSGPSADPDGDVLTPPSDAVCTLVSNGNPVTGQETMQALSFVVSADVVLKFDISLDQLLPDLKLIL